MSDYIIRGMAADKQVRFFAANTKDLVEKARRIHNTSPIATAALGRLMTGTAMMGSMCKNYSDLFALAKNELFTALVGDILDTKKRYHQFLCQEIKPLDSRHVLIGRAMPVLEADVAVDSARSGHTPLMEKPFGRMFEALDDLKEDEVYIATGSSFDLSLIHI